MEVKCSTRKKVVTRKKHLRLIKDTWQVVMCKNIGKLRENEQIKIKQLEYNPDQMKKYQKLGRT